MASNLFGRFEPAYPTATLRGADYNPRKIADDAMEMLKGSITALGFCKPIIVTVEGLIIAGHQRTKAARALGITSVPAWVLPSINKTDETTFNQIHNGTDLDEIDKDVRVPPGTDEGFTMVPATVIDGDSRSRGAGVRNEIAKLLLRYGNWGGAVATHSGLIVSSPQYALTCKLLGIPCRTWRVPDPKGPEARSWFGRAYGQFNYDHLERDTYIQTLAQPRRLRGNEGGKNLNSYLYELLVLPGLSKTTRLLDFGCGQRDYVDLLKSRGYAIWGMEFFYRDGSKLDTREVHRMVDALCHTLETDGLLDITMADSVINSVDTLQAEADVLTCLSAFCKPGDKIFFGGRRRETIDAQNNLKTAAAGKSHRLLEFIDENGFTAAYRQGSWFYQKFHYKAEALALAQKYFGHDCRYMVPGSSGPWQIATTKQVEHAPAMVEGALRREFDLKWPGGRSVGRADQVVAAWRKAQARAIEEATR